MLLILFHAASAAKRCGRCVKFLFFLTQSREVRREIKNNSWRPWRLCAKKNCGLSLRFILSRLVVIFSKSSPENQIPEF